MDARVANEREREEMGGNRINYAYVERLIKDGKKEKKASEVYEKIGLVLS